MACSPTRLVEDDEITLPPIGGGREQGLLDAQELRWRRGRHADASPRARELAQPRHRTSAHGGIEEKPEASLNRLCELALEAQIYRECMRYYPFVLGAQPVRPIDLAAFYAAIANEGVRPVPYAVESIERDGETIYRHEAASVAINSVDRAAFYQLKTLMQGVLARGTARSIAHMSPYVAGKTGTSDNENDAWFVGFTNDVTVAVWLGYDNADGKRRTLGGGATGGGVAVPIFEPVMRAVWANGTPKAALAPPSPEAKRLLSCTSVDPESGEQQRGGITECFRIDAKGRIIDTQNKLISRARASARAREDADERPARRVSRSRDEDREEGARVRRNTQVQTHWGWGGWGGWEQRGWYQPYWRRW